MKNSHVCVLIIRGRVQKWAPSVWLHRVGMLYSAIIKNNKNMKKLEVLNEMFSKCGNGVRVMVISDVNEKDRFRIYRNCDLGNRVNWVKCKKILNENNIKYSEGDSGWGMMLSRCIDFEF